jgi:polar amino acid transport system substrate-binding protein
MAATRGFGGMGDAFLKAERDGTIKVLRLTSDEQSFNMLLSGRVQAVPSDLEVGYVLLRKLYGDQAEQFTHNSNLILNSNYHLVISKKNSKARELITQFNEGLALLRKSGRYDQIVHQWYSAMIYKSAVPEQFLSMK